MNDGRRDSSALLDIKTVIIKITRGRFSFWVGSGSVSSRSGPDMEGVHGNIKQLF